MDWLPHFIVYGRGVGHGEEIANVGSPYYQPLGMNSTHDKIIGSTMLLLLRAAFQLVISFVIWGGLLFGSAGDVTWLRGWLHIGVWLVTFAVNASVLLRLNQDVFSARLKPKWSSERADTILLMFFLVVMLAIPVVAGLDTVRFGWSSLPFWAVFLGIALHASGDAFVVMDNDSESIRREDRPSAD